MNSGAPFGPSSRSPSPELAAAAGWLASARNSATANSPERTAPQLTARWPPRFRRVAQCVVHGLEREVRLRHAEPVPILVLVARVGAFPEPHEADVQPRPLFACSVEGSHRVARLERVCDAPELLDGERRRIHVPAHFGGPDRG